MSRWSERAATKRLSTCIWKTRPWWAAWRGPVTRRANPTARAARRKERFTSAASSGSSADRYYAEHPEPEYGPAGNQLGTRVAIVGSGPAGLSAAFYLARQGYRVTIFEAEKEAGGMLRTAIPPYRLPKDVVDRDIKNVRR